MQPRPQAPPLRAFLSREDVELGRWLCNSQRRSGGPTIAEELRASQEADQTDETDEDLEVELEPDADRVLDSSGGGELLDGSGHWAERVGLQGPFISMVFYFIQVRVARPLFPD